MSGDFAETLQAFYWQATTALAIIFCWLLIVAFLKMSFWKTAGLALILTLFLKLIPLGWLSAYDYIGSAMGPLSSAFLVLCLFSGMALLRGNAVLRPSDEAVFTGIVTVIGAALYFSTTGFLAFPVYPIGFDLTAGLAFGVGLLAIALMVRSWMLVTWVLFATALWLLNAINSFNFFDYLIDPVSWITSTVLFVAHVFSWLGRPLPFRGLRMSSRP